MDLVTAMLTAIRTLALLALLWVLQIFRLMREVGLSEMVVIGVVVVLLALFAVFIYRGMNRRPLTPMKWNSARAIRWYLGGAAVVVVWFVVDSMLAEPTAPPLWPYLPLAILMVVGFGALFIWLDELVRPRATTQ